MSDITTEVINSWDRESDAHGQKKSLEFLPNSLDSVALDLSSKAKTKSC